MSSSAGEKEDTDLENGNSGHTANGGSSQDLGKKQAPQDDGGRTRQALLPWIREHFSWSWFTAPQSTGGVATLLSLCPKQFSGLEIIGVVIFIFNIVMYLTFLLFAVLRFASRPKPFRALLKSLVNPPECYFFGSLLLSSATMIINTERYGVPHSGPWLIVAVRVLFWIYAALSLLLTILQTSFIFQYTSFQAINFTPAMIITILQAMLTGTIAASISENQPPAQRLPIMVAGVAYQGLGWIVCTLFLTLCIANLLENGWPGPNLRPGMFIMVGTSGFTIVALIGIARACPEGYAYFAKYPQAAQILQVLATWIGIFLWLFSFWVFGLAVVVNLVEVVSRDEESGKLKLNVKWTNTAWAGIFPNVGWILGTIYLGQELDSNAILWVSVAMTLILVAFWLLDLIMMAQKVLRSMFIDSRIKLD